MRQPLCNDSSGCLHGLHGRAVRRPSGRSAHFPVGSGRRARFWSGVKPPGDPVPSGGLYVGRSKGVAVARSRTVKSAPGLRVRTPCNTLGLPSSVDERVRGCRVPRPTLRGRSSRRCGGPSARLMTLRYMKHAPESYFQEEARRRWRRVSAASGTGRRRRRPPYPARGCGRPK